MRIIKYRQPYYVQGELKSWHYWGVTGKGEFTYPIPILDTKGEQGQQFTGLTDKNGVEIYEGDLLMVKNVRICEVIFHREAGCWDLLARKIISGDSIGGVSPASYQYHTEVIGNIYESPELLENK